MILSQKEHLTRAMLLGMRYIADGHYYYGDAGIKEVRLDASTLEPISYNDAFARIYGKKATTFSEDDQ